MSIAILILSISALLLSVANIALWLSERKQSDKRYCAMLSYTDSKCDSALDAAELTAKECAEVQSKQTEAALRNITLRVEALEKGLCPDYEKAREAADAVNDFNAGISAILTFDPIATSRARRMNAVDKEAD
jgi:hypothetical protein